MLRITSTMLYMLQIISLLLSVSCTTIRRVVTHNTLFSKGKVIMIIIVIVTLRMGVRSKSD